MPRLRVYIQKRASVPCTTLSRSRFYKMRSLCGVMDAGGQLEALAVLKISALTASFDWDLLLYINPNKPWWLRTEFNLYGEVKEAPEKRQCVRGELISPPWPCLEPFLQSSGAQTHTELHVGDCCSHRSTLHIHRWITARKNARPAPPKPALCTLQLETISGKTYLTARSGIDGSCDEQTMKVERRSAENE